MARQARQLAASGIYHIMWRGIDKSLIFEDDFDRLSFLKYLHGIQSADTHVCAYALMGNHVHVLLKTLADDGAAFERATKSLGVRYVEYYNRRYQRTGPLFQGRNKSQPVEDTHYFLRALRYIHNNPVKAGICADPADFQWSSFRDYFSKEGKTPCMPHTEYALELMPLKELKAWHCQIDNNEQDFYDMDAPATSSAKRMPDEEAKRIIQAVTGCATIPEFAALPTDKRDQCLEQLKGRGIGQRQLSRLTGVSCGVISRIHQAAGAVSP